MSELYVDEIYMDHYLGYYSLSDVSKEHFCSFRERIDPEGNVIFLWVIGRIVRNKVYIGYEIFQHEC